MLIKLVIMPFFPAFYFDFPSFLFFKVKKNTKANTNFFKFYFVKKCHRNNTLWEKLIFNCNKFSINFNKSLNCNFYTTVPCRVRKKRENKNCCHGDARSCLLKFTCSEKATKFCEISTLLLSYVVPVKRKVKISQNFVAFSEYMNFKAGRKTKKYR